MEANNFEVIDVGVDVPKETFVKKVAEHRPEILGLSGVLTYTVEAMKEVVEALAEAGLREQVKVIVGGGHLTAASCDYIGADAFANDALLALNIVCVGLKSQYRERNNHGSSGIYTNSRSN